MIQPTDEMIQILEGATAPSGAYVRPATTRERLAAVLAIVERDYVIRPRTVIGLRPEMLSDRLGYPGSVGDEDWRRMQDGKP